MFLAGLAAATWHNCAGWHTNKRFNVGILAILMPASKRDAGVLFCLMVSIALFQKKKKRHTLLSPGIEPLAC
jgi:hypothetical protein